MHTATPKEDINRKIVTVSQEEACRYSDNLKCFEQNFQKSQSQFQQSEDFTYYIVSTKFIQQWIDFCRSQQKQRRKPASMNADIVSMSTAPSAEQAQLAKNLVEGEHFQIVNESIFSLFAPFNQNLSVNNRRTAVFVGKEKRVVIYPSSFKYIICTHDLLKAIDFNHKGAKDLKLSIVHISEEGTLQNLIDQALDQQNFKKGLFQTRIWESMAGMTIQKLHKLIRQELKPCSLANYKVSGVGKCLQDKQAKICDVITNQEQMSQTFFIIEAKTHSERFTFMKDDEGRCQGCSLFSKLDIVCGCKKVKYCSENCMEKDKHYHIRRCPYAEEMELNKKVQMVMTERSLNGSVGLNNLGNTCFMNSCLQCLSHTMPLTQYFLNMHFEAEINKTNPIGTKGKLAKNYAKFIQAMWCGSDDTFSPYSVKNAVSDINPMFSGYAQHDSQEFFSFLVDGLHEDLNRVDIKPYVESVDQNNKNQAQLARESWVAHLKRNQSVIVDTMSGQYRSIVTCPDCNHKSTTFDPFITVTLPIPQTIEKSTDFFFIRANMHSKTQRSWIQYIKGDANQWNEKAFRAVKAQPNQCCLYVVTVSEGVYRVGRDNMAQIVNKIENQHKNLFLIEFTTKEAALPPNRCAQFVIRFSKQRFSRAQNLFFKLPFIFDNASPLTGIMVYKKLLLFLYGQAYEYSKNKKTFGWGAKSYEDYQEEMLECRPFILILRFGKRIERGYTHTEYIFRGEKEIQDHSNIFDLIQQTDSSINDCELDARFDSDKMGSFSFKELKNFETVGKQPKASTNSVEQLEIQKCFQRFEEPEVLEAGNQWYCPKCKDHKLAVKKLSIYRAPKVLIIHLKRFKQKGTFKKQKNQTTINFPTTLDMTHYLINPDPMEAYQAELQKLDPSILIPPKYTPTLEEKKDLKSKPVYELYALSNHFGSLSGGHYTAYAKDTQGQWLSFNDSHVSKCSKKDIINNGNYLLFFQRK